jgi:SagB-type dehydrogenase family enzyme
MGWEETMNLVPAFLTLLLTTTPPTAAPPTPAETPASIELPAPEKAAGLPLMESLARRATSRAFDTRELPLMHLSNVLWAAFGINRPDGKRTAPSARNWRETDIYVLLKQGAYVYDAQGHRLVPVLAEDIRALGAAQAFAREAPVTLVFVADLSKMDGASTAGNETTAAMDTGFISQNVYLYCASAGLATGVRGSVDRDALGKRLGLREGQRITAAQSIGYPKE